MSLPSLESKLQYTFRDPSVLQVALCHKSYANEGRKRGQNREDFVLLHNERLEFLGDAVLGLVISDLLGKKFPHADEGMLSKMRSTLVREETLAKLSRSLGFGEHLLLGKGEEASQGRDKDSILCSTYESVLGALYLDGGFNAAMTVVERHFAELIASVASLALQHDTKTKLQEICQVLFRRSPQYLVVREDGPDHEKEFEVMVTVGELSRYGRGRNKKEAEQAAARFLLDHLLKEPGMATGQAVYGS